MGVRSATGTFSLLAKVELTNAQDDAQTGTANLGTFIRQALENGVAENQIDRAWSNQSGYLQSGETLDISLSTFANQNLGMGHGKDALGQTMDLLAIVGFGLTQTAGAGRLELNPSLPASNATWVPTLSVANGGAFYPGRAIALFAPGEPAINITPGSADVIRLKATGG